MILHILRHAKTNQLSDTGKDFDRALLPKGKLQAEALGHYLKSKNLKPDRILCSSAKRTRETLDLVEKVHSFGIKTEFENRLYLASGRDLLSIIWEQTEQEQLLLVGHNEGISDLASYFLDDEIELSTGQFISISFSSAESWKETSKGTGSLINNFRPEVTG